MLQRLWKVFDSVVTLEEKNTTLETTVKPNVPASGDYIESELSSRSDCTESYNLSLAGIDDVIQQCDEALRSAALGGTLGRLKPGAKRRVSSVNCLLLYYR